MSKFPTEPRPLQEVEEKNRFLYLQLRETMSEEELLHQSLHELAKLFDVHSHTPWGPEKTMAQEMDVGLNLHERYFPIGLHAHKWLELLCVVRGKCPHQVGKHAGVLQEGDILVISPGTQHSFLAVQDDCMVVNLYFYIDRFEQVHQPIMRSRSALSTFLLETLYVESYNAYMIFHTGDYFRGENFLASLLELWYHPKLHLRERANNLVQMFLFDVIDYSVQAPDISINMNNGKISNRTLMEYIRTHAPTVTVQELSEVFSYSARQIARVFKQATGMTCKDYIQQCREELFLSLMVGSDMSVSRSMELAGIRSPSQFYTDFRKKYGMSPVEYREVYGKSG